MSLVPTAYACDDIEVRDGWFDAHFRRPDAVDAEELERRARSTRPVTSDKRGCLAVIRDVVTTRSGIRLSKAFVAFFVAYVLCLVPRVQTDLGRYSHVMVVSCIINHPARTVGAQIDGTVLTIAGTAGGLAWGAFGLWLSTSTAPASIGYGGILALFLCVCAGGLAALRSYFMRLYQFALCAGFAIVYTCLAECSGQEVVWAKLLRYGVPWILGQAICLATCIVWFPDAGTRGVAVALNHAFRTMKEGLHARKGQSQETRSKLSKTFIDLSQAYRDFAIDLTVSVFDPRDVLTLRNVLQGVVRSMLSMKPEPAMYGRQDSPGPDEESATANTTLRALVFTTVLATPGLSEVKPEPLLGPIDPKEKAIRVVRYRLDEPTKALVTSMAESLGSCHAVLMDMAGYRRYLGPDGNTPSDTAGSLVDLRRAMIAFDESESALLEGDELTAKYVPEVVEIFTFCRPIRQTATAVEAALVAVNHMQQRKRRPAVNIPSYPWRKSLNRQGPQVRHDRGGVTAGSYFRTFRDIKKLTHQIRTSEHCALVDEPDLFAVDSHGFGHWPESGPAKDAPCGGQAKGKEKEEKTRQDHDTHAFLEVGGSKVRHQLWKVGHRLQGYEMRFALKNAIVLSLLAIPAWLPDSRDWWNRYESWWAVAMAWLTMHPRVGGSVRDLLTRASMAVVGVVWAGFAYAAAPGNPYVMTVFATVYMIPMLYRFTQSNHPRSGLVGCISFTVTSLALVTDRGQTDVIVVAGTLGAAFVVGVVSSVMINWLIWPFVARHELRKALSGMIFFLSIVYRNIIAKYVYFDQQHGPPTVDDVRKSEILEGRLREGFVRIRELMVSHLKSLTRHEVRLRAPFDENPYRLLADACERFFDYLVAVRQSAMSFHPKYVGDDANDEAVARILHHRRDAVAAVLTNLYVLACALRSGSAVPKYLPSAAAARARLGEKMAELEAEYENDRGRPVPQMAERRKWSQVYTYSYNESLTGCVTQLEELERYTKVIVGEQGFDDPFEHDSPYEEE